jgi:photosystem II stability/assembly factor-like uncharacterized protein
VEAIALVPGQETVVYAAARDTESSTSGLFRSDDGGLSWTLLAQAPFQASVRRLAIDPTGTQRMLALTTSGGREYVYRSEDGGASWVQTRLFVSDQRATVFFDPVAADTAYLFGGGELKRSEAGGAWEEIGGGYSAWVSPEGALFLAEAIQTPCGLIFLCYGDKVFVSRTQGRTFDPLGTGTCLDPDSIVYAPSDPSVAYGTAAICLPLVKSTDGGALWKPVEVGELAGILGSKGRVAGIAVDPLDPASIFLAVVFSDDPNGGLLLRSGDGGERWTRVPVPEPPTGPIAIGPSDRVLYLGTVQGVFRRPLGRTQTLPAR